MLAPARRNGRRELRENLKAACVQRDVALYAAYRSNSEDWILHMVREGIGVAILPEHTLPLEPQGVGFRYLEDPPLEREVSALLSTDKPQKAELKSLVRFLGG